MKTITFKSILVIFCMMLGFGGLSAQTEDKFIYDCKYDNGILTSKTVFEKNDNNELTRKLKYDYSHDDQGRIIEKTAYRWNSDSSKWENYYQMICNYDDNNQKVTIDYAKWNKHKKGYTDDRQQQVYEHADAQHILANR